MLMCPAAHIGAQAYAILIDSYGGYILESFAAHSVKKNKETQKAKRCTKKRKKPHQKKKERKKRKVKKIRSACIQFSPCAEILLLVEPGP